MLHNTHLIIKDSQQSSYDRDFIFKTDTYTW